MNKDVIRIIQILEFRRAPVDIKKKIVADWLSSNDPNVIAAAADAVVMYPRHMNPPLTTSETFDALRKNFQLHLSIEKAPTVYGTSCYEAARDLFRWLIGVATTSSDELRDLVAVLKEFLEMTYLAADERQRSCIQNGLLEHLFEYEPFREAFSDWRDVPVLRDAFENASRWSDWAKARVFSLEEIADRTATNLRTKGFQNACPVMPSAGSVVVSVVWETGELWLMCDDEWVKLALQAQVRLDDAVEFVSSSNNWTVDPTREHTFTVELSGARFAQ